MQISDDESKISISSFVESVESGEILASSSEWKMGLDELFVTCLNDNSDKIAKPTSLNHMSIKSRLVSQPNKKLKLNNEQLNNSTDLSPITFV